MAAEAPFLRDSATGVRAFAPDAFFDRSPLLCQTDSKAHDLLPPSRRSSISMTSRTTDDELGSFLQLT